MTEITKTRAFEGNSEAIEAWNGVLFDKFSRFRYLIVDGLAHFGTHALARHRPEAGSRVLDIGCGFGDMTRELAEVVGSRGEAVGVDAAARFIEAAKSEALHIQQAQFLVRDVEVDDLGGPYQGAFSRFGTMFFTSPVAAFRNVRRSLLPGAKLVMTVWRHKEDNPWVRVAEVAVEKLVTLPATTDEATCGPGPFSMANANLLSSQLLAGGFGEVTLERFDAPVLLGRTLAEAVECGMAVGPAGEVLRLAGSSAEALKPEVAEALSRAFTPYITKEGVYLGGSAWVVSAIAG
ncbi:MAG: class I SAM-dependent methyltransferase [Polyangiaceae bacterium]|nr:class I SAM-dependent methyltransferase [Polyangiaceae bacterium]